MIIGKCWNSSEDLYKCWWKNDDKTIPSSRRAREDKTVSEPIKLAIKPVHTDFLKLETKWEQIDAREIAQESPACEMRNKEILGDRDRFIGERRY